MTHISSYSTIYALGHRAIADILSGPVVVEEKVDGSQFSMQRLNGELSCRSKGQDLIPDAPEKMFKKAVETAASLPLTDGYVYRCEFLQGPKHNTLAYGRTPNGNLILLDVETAPQTYMTPAEKLAEGKRIGLEVTPLIFEGRITDMAQVQTMIERESILGGCNIEGVVLKSYAMFTADKKVAMAKMVADGFKEKNAANWRSENPTKADVVQVIIAQLRTEARWQKAVQHLREAGTLTDSPKDIGNLIREAQDDILKEEKQWIADELYRHSIQQILRSSVGGLAEWYKEQLAQSAFEPLPEERQNEAIQEAQIH